MKRLSCLQFRALIPATLWMVVASIHTTAIAHPGLRQSPATQSAFKTATPLPPAKRFPLKHPERISLFEPPIGQDAPKQARGAGRRTTDRVCPVAVSVLTPRPLQAPQAPVESLPTILTPESTGGLTTSAHPTFLMYIPATSAKTLEFTLEDPTAMGEPIIYQMRMPIIEQPGIVRISMPETVPPLAVGKDYRWQVTLACRGKLSDPNDPLIEGWIRRQPAIAPASPGQPLTLETIQQYGRAGAWFDVSAGLAALRHNQPQDATVKALWVELLRKVNLEALAEFPVRN